MTDKSILKALIWDKVRQKGVSIGKYSTYKPDLQMINSICGNSVICIWGRSAIVAFRENLTDKNLADYPFSLIESARNFHVEEDNPMLLVFTFKGTN